MKRAYIIAEAGVNHNGSLAMAMELVDCAWQAGADAVKFQTFHADKMIAKSAPKADYQMQTTDKFESQLDLVQKLELSEKDHHALLAHCHKRGIEFLSTPFDLDSVNFLAYGLNLPCFKISSGDITNAPLLLRTARTGKKVILSTGMSLLSEVETALSILAFGFTGVNEKPSLNQFRLAYCSIPGQNYLRNNVRLLHCTTEYPAPYPEVNLRAMDTMQAAFGLQVGLSDHTEGIAVPIAAVACGAAIIEKHFTLNRNLPGPDHKASLEPDELTEMVKGIRQVEKALGETAKIPTASERKNIIVARHSVVAARDIVAGELFTEDNLTTKRAGVGISPVLFWDLLGKKAEIAYKQDEVIIE